MQPSGEKKPRSLFYRQKFQIHVPWRKVSCELYNENTVKLSGTDFLTIAYAELNDSQNIASLSHLLGTLPIDTVTEFVRFGRRYVECDGQKVSSPFGDLFFRSWTIAVQLFNKLLRYEEATELEQLQGELRRLSRAFDVAFRGLVGCGFDWDVDLLRLGFKTTDAGVAAFDAVPASNQALGGIHEFPLFDQTRPMYSIAATYALMSLLVLEIGFQKLEKRVCEILELEMNEENKELVLTFGSDIENIRNAITSERTTSLVFDPFNPLKRLVDGLDFFVSERYDINSPTSHLSILCYLSLTKLSIVLGVEKENVSEVARRDVVPICSDILSRQSVLDFVYKLGNIGQPAPTVKREEERSLSEIDNDNDYEHDTDNDEFSPGAAIKTVRAACLKKLGCQVVWENVKADRLPVDRRLFEVIELDGVDAEYSLDANKRRCSLVKALAALFCPTC